MSCIVSSLLCGDAAPPVVSPLSGRRCRSRRVAAPHPGRVGCGYGFPGHPANYGDPLRSSNTGISAVSLPLLLPSHWSTRCFPPRKTHAAILAPWSPSLSFPVFVSSCCPCLRPLVRVCSGWFVWRWLSSASVAVCRCGRCPPPSLFVGVVVVRLRRCLPVRLLPAFVAVCWRGYCPPSSLFIGAVAYLCCCLSARLLPASIVACRRGCCPPLSLLIGAAVARLCRCLSARLPPTLWPPIRTAMALDRCANALIALLVPCLACCRKGRLAGQPPSLHFGTQVSQSLRTQVSRSPYAQVSRSPYAQVSH